MLYIFDDMGALGGGFWLESLPRLSVQRREKALAYRFGQDKNLSAAAYLLLRYALKADYGIGEPVEFELCESGKPVILGYPGVHFNLSHCRAAVACAVASVPVGVDVQEIAPVERALAKRVLTEAEYRAFLASSDPDRTFCEYWTKKESWLKKNGLGIGASLAGLAAKDIEAAFFKSDKDYCCCAVGYFDTPGVTYVRGL